MAEMDGEQVKKCVDQLDVLDNKIVIHPDLEQERLGCTVLQGVDGATELYRLQRARPAGFGTLVMLPRLSGAQYCCVAAD